jgi:hypothetical protein
MTKTCLCRISSDFENAFADYGFIDLPFKYFASMLLVFFMERDKLWPYEKFMRVSDGTISLFLSNSGWTPILTELFLYIGCMDLIYSLALMS